jgi:hypothetical protein
MGSFVLPFLFVECHRVTMKEMHMRKSVSILFALLVVAGLSACAKAPARHVNTPDEQRSHAGQAQDELSSEVRK